MLIFWSCKKNRLDYKDKINFNIDHVTTSLTNNCNTHIDQIPRSKGNQALKFRHLTLSWRRPLYIETSPLICPANQWTGFYMITACVMKGLRYFVSLRIQSEYGKILTRKTPNTDTFHAVSLGNQLNKSEESSQNPYNDQSSTAFKIY